MPHLWLGSFRLDAPVAAGAMGAVWSATHRDGLPAAVKVIGGTASRHAGYRRAFQREVRATAGLTHANVVDVYDVGILPAEAETATRGALTAGSPYMVMAWVPDTLASSPPRNGAEALRALRHILQGLAHAHARGVVHRDLKPANVLVGDGRYQVADFGLAHPIDATGEKVWGGTANTMAPEQLERDFRAYGPWTDLFALGCVGWELLTGQRLYEAQDVDEARQAHPGLRDVPFTPRFEVPAGVEDWLRRLVALPPTERFQRAAHALEALPLAREEATTVSCGVCRIPTDWREPEPPPHPAPIGVGLVGLRPVPLVGREEARSLLWDDLIRCASGSVQARLLHGPEGVGLTRLAWWAAERAAEVGVPTVLAARFAARSGRTTPLVSMVERFLRLRGADREEVLRRLLEGVPEAMARRLTDLLRSDGSSPASWNRSTTTYSAWQVETVGEWMVHRAQAGPVVCLLDDLSFGPEGETLMRWLLERQVPILLVATCQDRSPGGRELLERWHDVQCAVAPLSEAEGGLLVQQLLPVEPRLGKELLARADHSPGFVVQLVESWAQQGVLTVGKDGYALVAGASRALPEGIRALWQERLDAALADRSPADRAALEVAAYLGAEVDPGEWGAACARLGLRPWRQLLFELEVRGLLRSTDDGSTRFAHPMLAEALVESSDAAGRGERVRSEVVALWMVEAEKLAGLGPAAEALRPLERALALAPEGATRLELRRRRGDEWRRTGRPADGLAELEAVRDEARRLDLAGLEAVALRRLAVAADQSGDSEDAVALFAEALAAHERAPDPEEQALTLHQLAWTFAYLGRLEESLRRIDEAIAIVPAESRATRFQLHGLGANVADTRGDDEVVRTHLACIEALMPHLGERQRMAALNQSAGLLSSAGRNRSARQVFGQAVTARLVFAGEEPTGDLVVDIGKLAERIGPRRASAVLTRRVADFEAAEGRSALALDLYAGADQMHAVMGDRQSALSSALGRLHVLVGRGDTAAYRRARADVVDGGMDYPNAAVMVEVLDVTVLELEGALPEACAWAMRLVEDPRLGGDRELALEVARLSCRLWRRSGRGPIPDGLLAVAASIPCSDVQSMERSGWLGEASGLPLVQAYGEPVKELRLHDRIAWWARRARALASRGDGAQATAAIDRARTLRGEADWPGRTLADLTIDEALRACSPT